MSPQTTILGTRGKVSDGAGNLPKIAMGSFWHIWGSFGVPIQIGAKLGLEASGGPHGSPKGPPEGPRVPFWTIVG